MKRTVIAILATAFITSVCCYLVGSVLRGAQKLWLISAVKAPGRMALDAIDADLRAGRLETAKSKFAALRKHWSTFDRDPEFEGQGIGDIMVAFAQIDAAAEPDRAAAQAQPARTGTNRTSPAADSAR